MASHLLLELAMVRICEAAFLGSGEIDHLNSSLCLTQNLCRDLPYTSTGRCAKQPYSFAHQIFLERCPSPGKLLLTLQQSLRCLYLTEALRDCPDSSGPS